MLKIKKFNVLKHKGLNSLFDFYIGKNSNLNADNIHENIHITSNKGYILIKENIVESYIFKLDDILLIHIKDNLINDFEFLYRKSETYVFDIYETSHPNLNGNIHIKMYHVFCVSKKLYNINYATFLNTNDSDKEYFCLSLLYGPCLIVNRRFDITSVQDKYKCKYKYLKSIGNGVVSDSIRNFIKSIIKMSNEYQDILPPHYLRIN